MTDIKEIHVRGALLKKEPLRTIQRVFINDTITMDSWDYGKLSSRLKYLEIYAKQIGTTKIIPGYHYLFSYSYSNDNIDYTFKCLSMSQRDVIKLIMYIVNYLDDMYITTEDGNHYRLDVTQLYTLTYYGQDTDDIEKVCDNALSHIKILKPIKSSDYSKMLESDLGSVTGDIDMGKFLCDLREHNKVPNIIKMFPDNKPTYKLRNLKLLYSGGNLIMTLDDGDETHQIMKVTSEYLNIDAIIKHIDIYYLEAVDGEYVLNDLNEKTTYTDINNFLNEALNFYDVKQIMRDLMFNVGIDYNTYKNDVMPYTKEKKYFIGNGKYMALRTWSLLTDIEQNNYLVRMERYV